MSVFIVKESATVASNKNVLPAVATVYDEIQAKANRIS